MSISNRIKRLPEILNENSLRQIAIKIGCSPQTLNKIAAGPSKPGFDIIASLLSEYPLNPDWLIQGEGEPIRKTSEGKHVPMIDTELYDMRKLVSEMDQLRKRVKKIEDKL